uniref:Uncharacterized protein n=1 Tax=Arthrobacter sp. 31.31 TaxID=347202 RepID=I3VZD5_9MICC|nr:hypothetical protein [Arthrobacter sp. 31.31]AFK88712.1 hypothetical protein [Arthrobacter sp. 31.31]
MEEKFKTQHGKTRIAAHGSGKKKARRWGTGRLSIVDCTDTAFKHRMEQSVNIARAATVGVDYARCPSIL